MSIYGRHRKTKLPLQHNSKIHALGGQFGNLRRISIGRMRIDRKPASSPRKPCDHAACPPLLEASRRPDPKPVPPISQTGPTGSGKPVPLVLQTSPTGFGICSTLSLRGSVLRLKLRNPSPDGFVAKPPNPACRLRLLAATLHRLLISDFILLFLPPCGPHLIPSATGSLEPSLLVFSTPRRSHRHRPFALVLHLHQRKSSCNLHLQY